MELKNNLYNEIESLSKKGNKAMEHENYSEALSFFQQAYDLLPVPKEEWEAYTWLMASIGDAYFSKQEYQSSLECFRRCYNNGDIDNPFILLRIGECSFELNDTENAKEFLLRAYMLEGKKIFKHEPKYFQWLSENIELKSTRKKTKQKVAIKQGSPDNPPITPTTLWMDESQLCKNEKEMLELNNRYWNNLEEPKNAQSLGFHLMKAFIIIYLKLGDYACALEWAMLFDNFDFVKTGRIDSGEKDYYVAIAYYENGEHGKAQEYFAIANKKSKGRCFQLLFGDKYKMIFNKSV